MLFTVLLVLPQLTPPCPALRLRMKKSNLPPWLRGACAGLILGSGALALTGCVATVREPGPAYSEDVYYDYDYYPGADVYYYPRGHVYYWNDRGEWHSGRELPPRIIIREDRPEHFRGHTQQPWVEHQNEGRAGQERYENHQDRDHDRY